MCSSPSIEIGLLADGWHESLRWMVSGAKAELLLVSPFITRAGLQFVTNELPEPTPSRQIKVTVVTDISPRNVCEGATDPRCILDAWHDFSNFSVWHLPALHAKIYAADSASAIITSANLTQGGLYHNYEYGVRIQQPAHVASVVSDAMTLAQLGAFLEYDSLAHYCDTVSQAQDQLERGRRRIPESVQSTFDNAIQHAHDELVRLKLSGGAMHAVFARTIEYLLKRHGALTTDAIHRHVQRIHPDLCDDSVDRIIDGHRFGKKWKHAVRTAQQILRKKDYIERDGDLWRIRRQSPA